MARWIMDARPTICTTLVAKLLPSIRTGTPPIDVDVLSPPANINCLNLLVKCGRICNAFAIMWRSLFPDTKWSFMTKSPSEIFSRMYSSDVKMRSIMPLSRAISPLRIRPLQTAGSRAGRRDRQRSMKDWCVSSKSSWVVFRRQLFLLEQQGADKHQQALACTSMH